ncbi:hypothetical protein AVEN_264756-1 [Araneus ventricosus]|uniref:Uncharacterized protein n=1 Tax=Araneus ventricosus TaxID=182803 RepID=A0A4Y2EDP5_ARAVE|nr:hypothetical protein AVEN_264756-1 [Araneus ventricosus]
MITKTPEPVPRPADFHAIPTPGRTNNGARFSMQLTHRHTGYSGESGIEPEILRTRNYDFATMPPQPTNFCVPSQPVYQIVICKSYEHVHMNKRNHEEGFLQNEWMRRDSSLLIFHAQ